MLVRSPRLNSMLATLAGLVFVALAVAWWFSGRWAAGAVTSAVERRDLGALVNRLDASRVKESAAEDWAELVPKNFKLPGVDAVADDVRSALIVGIRNVNVDTPTLADMLGHLLAGQGLVTSPTLTKLPKVLTANRTPSYSYAAGNSSDVYFMKASFAETGEQVIVTLERRGWFTWRVVRVQANSGSTLWPIKVQR